MTDFLFLCSNIWVIENKSVTPINKMFLVYFVYCIESLFRFQVEKMQIAVQKSLVYMMCLQVFAMMFMNVVLLSTVTLEWTPVFAIFANLIFSLIICESPHLYIGAVSWTIKRQFNNY